jgi:hypothetical protein
MEKYNGQEIHEELQPVQEQVAGKTEGTEVIEQENIVRQIIVAELENRLRQIEITIEEYSEHALQKLTRFYTERQIIIEKLIQEKQGGKIQQVIERLPKEEEKKAE